eukprot:6212837-Pleurochrysis_carterae.AAC.1
MVVHVRHTYFRSWIRLRAHKAQPERGKKTVCRATDVRRKEYSKQAARVGSRELRCGQSRGGKAREPARRAARRRGAAAHAAEYAATVAPSRYDRGYLGPTSSKEELTTTTTTTAVDTTTTAIYHHNYVGAPTFVM